MTRLSPELNEGEGRLNSEGRRGLTGVETPELEKDAGRSEDGRLQSQTPLVTRLSCRQSRMKD